MMRKKFLLFLVVFSKSNFLFSSYSAPCLVDFFDIVTQGNTLSMQEDIRGFINRFLVDKPNERVCSLVELDNYLDPKKILSEGLAVFPISPEMRLRYFFALKVHERAVMSFAQKAKELDDELSPEDVSKLLSQNYQLIKNACGREAYWINRRKQFEARKLACELLSVLEKSCLDESTIT